MHKVLKELSEGHLICDLPYKGQVCEETPGPAKVVLETNFGPIHHGVFVAVKKHSMKRSLTAL